MKYLYGFPSGFEVWNASGIEVAGAYWIPRRNDPNAERAGRQIATLLLDHGADIDANNGVGMTPIMFAAMFGRGQVVEQLKARGASLQRRNRLGLSAGFIVRVSRWMARLFSPLR